MKIQNSAPANPLSLAKAPVETKSPALSKEVGAKSDAFIKSSKGLLIGSAVGTLANPLAAIAFKENVPANMSPGLKTTNFARMVAMPGVAGTATSTLTEAVLGHGNLKVDFVVGAGSGALANTAVFGKNAFSIALGATAGGFGAISAHAIRNDQSIGSTFNEILTGQKPESEPRTKSPTASNPSVPKGIASGAVVGALYSNVQPLAKVVAGKGNLSSLVSHNKKMALSTLGPAITGAVASKTLANSPEAGAGVGFITGMLTGAVVNLKNSKADLIIGTTLGAFTGAAAGYATQK